MRLRLISFMILWTVGTASLAAEVPLDSIEDLNDLIRLVREEIPDLSEQQIVQAAAQGLLDGFPHHISLDSGESESGVESMELTAEAEWIDRKFIYLQVRRVVEGFTNALTKQIGILTQTNACHGLVLDLRSAKGQNFEEAATSAGLFLKNSSELLHVGDQIWEGKESSPHYSFPVMVLADRFTLGAPEILAALMRLENTCLIIGEPTAGQTCAMRTFPLPNNGKSIQLAVTPIQLRNQKALPEGGVQPDIQVAESAYIPQETKTGEETAETAPDAESKGARERLSNSGDFALGRDPFLVRAVDQLKSLYWWSPSERKQQLR